MVNLSYSFYNLLTLLFEEGTVLQIGRSLVRSQLVSVDFLLT